MSCIVSSEELEDLDLHRRGTERARSVRDDGGVQAVRDDVAVGQAVVLDGARRQTLERGVAQRVDDVGQALLRRLQQLLGRVALVVHRVDVRAVGQQRADHVRRARVQLQYTRVTFILGITQFSVIFIYFREVFYIIMKVCLKLISLHG